MASVKEYLTRFKIDAIFSGQRSFAQANAALDKTAKHARNVSSALQRSSVHVKGMYRSMTGAIATWNLGARAMQALTVGFTKSVDAAREAQQVHDQLGTSLERNMKRYDMQGHSIKEVQDALIGLAENMEKTGHDAETLEVMFAQLTKSMSPEQIEKYSAGLSDVLTYLHGVAPSAEQAADAAELMNKAILQGNLSLLRQLGATTDTIKKWQKLSKTYSGVELQQKRMAVLQEQFAKIQGETTRKFDTNSGKAAQASTQLGNIFENLGKPFIARSGEFAESFRKIAERIQPIAEHLAERLSPQLEKFANWFSTHVPEIISFIESVVDAVFKTIDAFVWLQAKSEELFKPLLETVKPLLTEFWNNLVKEITVAVEYWTKAWGQFYEASVREITAVVTFFQTTFGPLVVWFRDYVINPIAQAFEWLAEKVKVVFEFIKPMLSAIGSVLGKKVELPKVGTAVPTVPEALQFRYGGGAGGGGGGGGYLGTGGTAPVPATPTPSAWEDVTRPQIQAAVNASQPVVDSATVAQVLREAENKRIPAPIRHRNPGGMYPGEAARKFGSIGTSIIGGGHKIATFPTATHGAAANMWNLMHKGYAGQTVGSLMQKWSGGYRGVPGPAGDYPANMRVSQDMFNDPKFMVPFMKAIASGEAAGGQKVLSEDQWQQAFDWAQKGSPQTTSTLEKTVEQATKTKAAEQSKQLVPVGMTPTMHELSRELTPRQMLEGQQRIHLTSNAPITINGVPTGKEQVVANAVNGALGNNNQQMIEQLKRARDHEARLGYV